MELDLRLALRQFSRAWLNSTVNLAVLGAGLALNVALFAILDGVLFKPLPFRDPDRLVLITGAQTGGRASQPLTPAEFTTLREHDSLFEFVAAAGPGDLQDPDAMGDGSAIHHRQVTPELFDMLGVRPVHGQALLTTNAATAEPRSVVIGYTLWQSRFGGDRDVVGRILETAGAKLRVVAVMPAGFEFPFGANMWTGLLVSPESRRFAYLEAVARLRPGVSPADAEQRLRSTGSTSSYHLQPLSDALEPKHTLTIALMSTTALIALAIAWVQVASQLLGAAADRTGDVAIQMCLGASIWRIGRQCAAAGLLQGTLSLLVACAIAPAMLSSLLSWLPSSATLSHDVALDSRALIFATLASTIGLLVFTATPLLALREIGIAELVSGRATVLGGRPTFVRSALLIAQVGLACGLAYLGAVSASSALRIARTDIGFEPAHLLSVRISRHVIPLRENERLRAVIDGVVDDVSRGPQKPTKVAFSDTVPFGGDGFFRSVMVAGTSQALSVKTIAVSDGYFDTVGIPIVEGRTFHPADAGSSSVVVNEQLVRSLDVGGSALRVEVLLGHLRRQVIGVVGDVQDESPGIAPRPIVYARADRGGAERVLLIRTTEDHKADTLATLTHSLVNRTNQSQGAFNIRWVDDAVRRSTGLYRARSLLLTLLSLVVLALTAIGLLTSVSRLVTRHRYDIGIRMALGATPTNIRNWLLGQVMAPALCGIVLGTGAGIGAAQLARSLLFEVAPFDALSVGCVVVLLLTIALAATIVPASTAANVDPVRTLREQ